MEDMARKIDAHDVADWFINRIDRRMGEVITTDVVHRLLYFAQAWYLANTDWVERIRSGEYREFYKQQYGERLGDG